MDALVYRLDERAMRRRATAISVVESLAMIAPAALVTLLLAREGAFANRSIVVGAALLVVLAIARTLGVRARILRRLAAFEVRLDDASLSVTRLGDALTYPTAEIMRVVTLPGQLRGLRIFVWPKGDAGRVTNDHLSIDVPSGGARFGELRIALGEMVHGHAASKTSASVSAGARTAAAGDLRHAPLVHRLGYAGRVAFLVATFVFAPFIVDDLLRRSRIAAYLAVVAVGVVLRWNVRRSSMG